MPPELTGPESIRLARSNWRRSQIIEAALRLLETTGFHQMSVNELAKEAGISVGTIYQYVKNKGDILQLVIEDILDAYAEQVPAAMAGIDDPVERLSAGFIAYCRVVDGRRAVTTLGYRESRSLDRDGLQRVMHLEEETTKLLVACLDEGVDSGALIEHDTDLTAWNLILLAHMWSLKHWHFAQGRSVDDYAWAQLALMLRAVINPDAERKYARLLELPGTSAVRPRSTATPRPHASLGPTTPEASRHV